MKLKIIFLLIAVFSAVNAQQVNETRAVWLATNFRLDWPPPIYDEDVQKKALTEILDNLVQKNFNTVYFQVFINGTTLYKSQIAPMSYYISGELDDTTAYDPLEFAIKECHKRGLEIHAWINALRCFTGTENFIKEHPKHIMSLHPEWTVEKFIDGQSTYWLNPGIPQVRNYLVNIVEEIISKYDVDGIQLDFLRYPSRDFNDDESYNLYAQKKNRDNWRRENINLIVEKIHKLIAKEKSFVKFGITPIGIYQNKPDASGLQGFDDVYQDTQLWLKYGWIDYIVPQIYWDLNNNPKFEIVAKSWMENSFNKNIVLGIAAYKDDVVDEIDRMIDISREINSAGVSFFRYSNIKEKNFQQFKQKSFPARMAWKDSDPPDNIKFISAVVNPDNDKISISWEFPDSLKAKSDIFYSAIYKLNSPQEKISIKNLFAVTKASIGRLNFSIKNPGRMNYYFTMKTLDRFWNESNTQSNIVKAAIPSLTKRLEKFTESNKPLFIRDNEDNVIFMIFSSEEKQIRFHFLDNDESMSANLSLGLNLINLGKKNIELNSIKVIYSEQ